MPSALFIFASKVLGPALQICLEQIDTALILTSCPHEDSDGNCAATRNRTKLAAIKAFIRYVEFRRALCPGYRRSRSRPSRVNGMIKPRAASDEGGSSSIPNAPNIKTRLEFRDRAMLHLCYAGGLAVSEW